MNELILDFRFWIQEVFASLSFCNPKSKISKWRDYANTLARPALRRAHIVEETRLHFDCRVDVGAGDWREYGDLQCRQCCLVAALALRGYTIGGGGFLQSAKR